MYRTSNQFVTQSQNRNNAQDCNEKVYAVDAGNHVLLKDEQIKQCLQELICLDLQKTKKGCIKDNIVLTILLKKGKNFYFF